MDTRNEKLDTTEVDAPVRTARDSGDRALDIANSGDTVAALFTNPADAQRAVRELQDEGFPAEAIGVLMRGQDVSEDLVANPGAFIAEGAAIGAVEGGLLGGALGLLVGALIVPGVGPVVAGGALASALATAGPTALAGIGFGAATGGVVGALTGRGLPEAETSRLHEGLAEGAVAVTVHGGDRTDDAIAVLIRNNGDTGREHGSLNPLYRDQPAYVEREGHLTYTQPETSPRRGEPAMPVERADNLDVDVDADTRHGVR